MIVGLLWCAYSTVIKSRDLCKSQADDAVSTQIKRVIKRKKVLTICYWKIENAASHTTTLVYYDTKYILGALELFNYYTKYFTLRKYNKCISGFLGWDKRINEPDPCHRINTTISLFIYLSSSTTTTTATPGPFKYRNFYIL